MYNLNKLIKWPLNAFNEVKAQNELYQIINVRNWNLLPNLMSRGTATNIYLLLLARILIEIKPNNVLEIGVGETTKLITAYCDEHETKCLALDHDEIWVNRVKTEKNSKNVKYLVKPLVKNNRHEKCQWYENITFEEEKYELVNIDGPPAWKKKSRNSRMAIIDHIKNISYKNTIFILDDVSRKAEKKLAINIRNKMQDLYKEPYFISYIKGMSDQAIIFGKEHIWISMVFNRVR